MYKKIKVFFLLILTLFVFSSCDDGTKNQKPQSTEPVIVPILNEYDLALTIDESFTLQVLNYEGKVEWSVSNYKILSVDENGVVVCLGVGKANVMAQADDKTLVCEVVCSIDYQAKPYIELDGEVNGENGYSFTLAKGDEYELSPVLKVAGAPIADVQFTLSSSQENVEIVGNVFKGKTPTDEAAVLTISCEYNGKTYSLTCAVSVSEV